MPDDYDHEKIEYMEGVKTHLEETFADFIVVGIDLTGDIGRIISVGIGDDESKSNSARVARMVGELHDIIFNLQMESNGFVAEIIDEEDDEEVESDQPWENNEDLT